MQNSNLSRRKVTAGIAWSVPAVAAVAAAPAFAASPVCPVVSGAGPAVKFPGNSGGGIKQAYGFDITITNTTGETLILSPGDVKVKFDKKSSAGTVLLYNKSLCEPGARELTEKELTLAPGASLRLFFVANQTGNSANTPGCIDGTVDVALVGKPVTTQDVCKQIIVPQVCFGSTPPAC